MKQKFDKNPFLKILLFLISETITGLKFKNPALGRPSRKTLGGAV